MQTILRSPAIAALVSHFRGLADSDTVLNITWIADANLASNNSFGLPCNANLGNHPGDAYASV